MPGFRWTKHGAIEWCRLSLSVSKFSLVHTAVGDSFFADQRNSDCYPHLLVAPFVGTGVNKADKKWLPSLLHAVLSVFIAAVIGRERANLPAGLSPIMQEVVLAEMGETSSPKNAASKRLATIEALLQEGIVRCYKPAVARNEEKRS